MKAESPRRELRVLLGVVAIATGAAAGVTLAARVAPRTPAAPIILVHPVVVEMAKPRTLPTGAPACGNVTARPIPVVTP